MLTNFLFAPTGAHDAIEAHAIYIICQRFLDIGVDQAVVSDLATWANAIWTNPNTDWEQWIIE